MAVFSEQMNKLDVENTKQSLVVLENYILYMQERIEFAVRNVTRSVTSAGVSSAEVMLMVETLNNSVAALQSSVNGLTGTVTTMGGSISALGGTVNNINSRLDGIDGTLSSLDARVRALEEAQPTSE